LCHSLVRPNRTHGPAHHTSSTYNMMGRPLFVAAKDGRTWRKWPPSIAHGFGHRGGINGHME